VLIVVEDLVVRRCVLILNMTVIYVLIVTVEQKEKIIKKEGNNNEC